MAKEVGNQKVAGRSSNTLPTSSRRGKEKESSRVSVIRYFEVDIDTDDTVSKARQAATPAQMPGFFKIQTSSYSYS